jgi:hypothetical protein
MTEDNQYHTTQNVDVCVGMGKDTAENVVVEIILIKG